MQKCGGRWDRVWKKQRKIYEELLPNQTEPWEERRQHFRKRIWILWDKIVPFSCLFHKYLQGWFRLSELNLCSF